MSLVDNTAERFLRIAAARWPADLRDDQSREWAGELYAIRHDDGSGRLGRAWTQLRFAFSLAASPPAADPDQIPNGWRRIVPRLGLTLRRCLMLVGVGLLCIIVVGTLDIVASAWTELSSDPVAIPREYVKATTFLALVAGIALAGWFGNLLGRRMPLHLRHQRRFGSLATGTIVAACLYVGVIVLSLRDGLDAFENMAGQLAGLAFLLPVGVLVSALAARGRRRSAVWWGAGLSLVLFELVSIPLGAMGRYNFINDPVYAPYADADVSYVDLPASLAWFPRSLVYTGVKPGGLAAELEMYTMSAIAGVMPILLTIAAFALMYLSRSATTAPVAVPDPVPASAPAAPAVSVWRRRLGLSATGLGVIAWAAVLAFAQAPVNKFGNPLSERLAAAWTVEARDWAITLACLGLAWALSGRTRVLLPSIAFGAVLLCTDIIVDRTQFTGTGAFLLTAALGGALSVAAWLIPSKMDKHPSTAIAGRRTVVAIAVLAAYCAPVALARFQFVVGPAGTDQGWQVPVIPLIMTVLSAVFAVIAGTAAIAGRNRPLPRTTAIAVVGVPVAISAALGVTAQLGLPVLGTITAVLLGVPMVVFVTAVMHWDRRERTGADVFRWAAGGLGVTVASVLLMVYPQYVTTMVFGNTLLSLRGTGPGGNTFPMFTGILLGAVVYAIAVALVTVRGKRGEAASRSVPDGGEGTAAGKVAPA